MKTAVNAIAIFTVTALLGACAHQAGCGYEREYRNPYLRAKRIAEPVDASPRGDLSCTAQSTQ